MSAASDCCSENGGSAIFRNVSDDTFSYLRLASVNVRPGGAVHIVTSGRGRVNIVCEDTSCLPQSPAADLVDGDQKYDGYCVLSCQGVGGVRGGGHADSC